MIVGFGIDIMSTERIKKAIDRFGDRFIKRIYTSREIELVSRRKNQYEVYAAYWAVKEATMKALGTGNRMGVYFKDIEILHEKSGKPYLKLYNWSKKHAVKLGVKNVVVSMSHLEDIVVGSVIFED
ncbi:holo-ACP synthase [candidate division WOR-3 bacterium]|nr:holo-ACP synthase [candidate division WOR-3 bacterium]